MRRPSRRVAAAAAIVAAAAAVLAAWTLVANGPATGGSGGGGCDAGEARVLWSSDAESGDLAEWNGDGSGGVYNTGTGRVTADGELAHRGSRSWRLSVEGAHGTTGNQAVRLFRWGTAGGEPLPRAAWYSAWFYFPEAAVPRRFWNVFQWKTKLSSDHVDPTFVLNVDARPGGRMGLYLWDAIAGGVVRGEAPVDLPPRRWVHLEACYVWSTAATGRVTFWQDGEQIIDVRDVRTEHPSEEPDARQWSIDNYTDGIDPPDLSILVDDAAISTGRLGP